MDRRYFLVLTSIHVASGFPVLLSRAQTANAPQLERGRKGCLPVIVERRFASELGGKILQLGEPVAHRQNGRPPTIVFCFIAKTIDLKEELAPP